jgi:hypothetical protein
MLELLIEVVLFIGVPALLYGLCKLLDIDPNQNS